MFNMKQVKTLEQSVTSLEAQIATLTAERDTSRRENQTLKQECESLKQSAAGSGVLAAELGTSDPAEIVALVRGLEEQVQTAHQEQIDDESLEGLNDPKAVLIKIRTFTHKIEGLNGAVSSMEEQLMSLYEDKERLEREVGASEVEDVLEAFRNLQNIISSMESQLMTMYAGRELMEVEIGVSDPREIVRKFRNLAGLVSQAHQELGGVAQESGATNGLGYASSTAYAMAA